MQKCMNWAAISFDWNQIRAFWATAEEGSFSAAARALGQTQPTLGRQVAALEEDLGVTLFERAGRSLLPTKAGLDLLEHCREMGAAAQRISLTASGASQAVEGQVRITATDIMCLHVLPPAVAQIRRVAPGIEVDLVAANDIRDLLRREADIAVRHVRPEQADLTARLVQEATARPYAATRYLEARGRPASDSHCRTPRSTCTRRWAAPRVRPRTLRLRRGRSCACRTRSGQSSLTTPANHTRR